MFSEFQLSAMCQESGVRRIFQSKEEAMYLIWSARFSNLFRLSTHGIISTKLNVHTRPFTFISKIVTKILENISPQDYGVILAP